MTGEITRCPALVLPVGGIKEKVMAAQRAGVRQVILPRDNEVDLQELPDKVRQELKFTLADRIEDWHLQASTPGGRPAIAVLAGAYVVTRVRENCRAGRATSRKRPATDSPSLTNFLHHAA